MLLLCTYTCFIALYREKWNWTSLLVASFRNFGNEYCQLVIDLHLHCFCKSIRLRLEDFNKSTYSKLGISFKSLSCNENSSLVYIIRVYLGMIQISTPVRVNKHTIEHFPQNANFDLPVFINWGAYLQI